MNHARTFGFVTEYSPQAANASRSHNFDNEFYFVFRIIQSGRCTASACRRSLTGHPSQQKSHPCGWLFCWVGWPDSDRRVRESKSRALPLGDIPLRSRSAFAPRELNCFYKCQLLTLKFSSTDEVPLSDEFTTEIKVFPRLIVSFSPLIPVIESSDVSLARLHLIGTYLPSDM